MAYDLNSYKTLEAGLEGWPSSYKAGRVRSSKNAMQIIMRAICWEIRHMNKIHRVIVTWTFFFSKGGKVTQRK